MIDDLGEATIDKMKNYKAVFDDVEKMKVMQFYKKLYYQKFNNLQLTNPINPPIQLKYTEIIQLAVVDYIDNLLEAEKEEPELLEQLKSFVLNKTVPEHYLGFHRMIRSYTKTL